MCCSNVDDGGKGLGLRQADKHRDRETDVKADR
jgi:hypothetical protein